VLAHGTGPAAEAARLRRDMDRELMIEAEALRTIGRRTHSSV
jgi:hypothetical protein